MTETVDVFLCYRHSDGSGHAAEIFELLDDKVVEFDDGVCRRLSIYFDQDTPGVSDWKSHHFPALKSAKAFIVISTHGLRADLSDSGSRDFAYEELQFWCNKRNAAPIVVDAVPNSNGRWVPTIVSEKWPDINRLKPPEGQNDWNFLKRIVGTIQTSEHVTNRQNVTELERLNRRLKMYAVILIVLIAVSLLFASAAGRFGYAAKQQAARAESATQSIVDLFAATDPDQIFTGATAAEQLLEIAESVIVDRTEEPLFRFRILISMGSAHTGLENHDKALALLTKAEELEVGEVGAELQFRLDLAVGEANLYLSQYDLARQRLDCAKTALDNGLSQRSSLLVALGDWQTKSDTGSEELARRHYMAALELDEEIDVALVARDHNRLASLAYFNRNIVGAKHHSELAADFAERSTSPLDLAESKYNLGAIAYEEENLELSQELYGQALVAFKRYYNDDHPQVSDTEASIGRILIETGHSPEAVGILRIATQNMEKRFGSEHWSLAIPLNNLALAIRDSSEDDAEEYFVRAAAIGESDGNTIAGHSLVHLSEISMDRGDLITAGAHQARANEVFSKLGVDGGWEFALLQGSRAEHSLRRLLELDPMTACHGENSRTLETARSELQISSAIIASKWTNRNYYTTRQELRERLLANLETACGPSVD